MSIDDGIENIAIKNTGDTKYQSKHRRPKESWFENIFPLTYHDHFRGNEIDRQVTEEEMASRTDDRRNDCPDQVQTRYITKETAERRNDGAHGEGYSRNASGFLLGHVVFVLQIRSGTISIELVDSNFNDMGENRRKSSFARVMNRLFVCNSLARDSTYVESEMKGKMAT